MKNYLFPFILMLQACGTQYSDEKDWDRNDDSSIKRVEFRQSLYAFSYDAECPEFGKNAIISPSLLLLESKYLNRKSRLYKRIENTQVFRRDLDIWKAEKALELEPEIDCQFIDRKLTFDEENSIKKQLENKNGDLDDVEKLLKILARQL